MIGRWRASRVNGIYGKNAEVYGVDFGLFNLITDKGAGIMVGIINSASSGSVRDWGGLYTDALHVMVAHDRDHASYKGIMVGGSNYARNFEGSDCPFTETIMSILWVIRMALGIATMMQKAFALGPSRTSP